MWSFAYYFIPSPFLFTTMTILNTASCLGLYLFRYTLPNNKHFVDYKKSDLLEGNKDLRASKKTSIQKSRSVKANKINNRSFGILKSSLHPKAGNISLPKRKELLFKKKHTIADKKLMEFLNQKFKDKHQTKDTNPSDFCLPCTSPESSHNLVNTSSSKPYNPIMNKPVLKTSDDLCICHSINDVASPRATDFFSYLRHFSSSDTPLKSIKN